MHYIFISSKRVVKLWILITVSWLCGFFIFHSKIPDSYEYSNQKTDAVIVLTGAKGRIDEGIKAFFKYDAKKLLISGAGGGITKDLIMRKMSKINPTYQYSDKVIVLGNIATSTFTNALETRIFLDLNHLDSYRLVTSSYHYPRTKYIFEHVVPDKTLVMHPLFTPAFRKTESFTRFASLKLTVTEYNKMIFAMFMVFSEYLDVEWKNYMQILGQKIKDAL
ncbi:MAG: YdcF family protein [Candidatus Jidaibacter sp.]|nr:YdcF family protein [Candidatus Jidaibacter sp.]